MMVGHLDAAWALTKADVGMSKAAVCQMTGASDGTLATMRRGVRALVRYGIPPETFATWDQARPVVLALTTGKRPACPAGRRQ